MGIFRRKDTSPETPPNAPASAAAPADAVAPAVPVGTPPAVSQANPPAAASVGSVGSVPPAVKPPVAPDPMSKFALIQAGKVLNSAPISDNVQVVPLPGFVGDWKAVLAELRVKYPRAVFTWCAKGVVPKN